MSNKENADLMYCKTLDGKVWVVWSTDQPGTSFQVYPIEYLGNAQAIKTIDSLDCVLVSTDLEAVKSATSNLMRIEVIVCPNCGHKAKPNSPPDAYAADSWFTTDSMFSKKQALGEGWVWLPSLGCPSCGTIFLPVDSTKQIVTYLDEKVSDKVSHEAVTSVVLAPAHFNEYLTFNWQYTNGTPLPDKWMWLAIEGNGDVFVHTLKPDFDGCNWAPRSLKGDCMYLYSAAHLIEHASTSLLERHL